jgi:hypothetical protein
MVCYAYAPAPSFALITYTVWPEFLIPPRCPRQEAAVLSPRVQKIRRETAEYRHGTTPFILPVKTSMGTHDGPCVVAPHVTEVGE